MIQSFGGAILAASGSAPALAVSAPWRSRAPIRQAAMHRFRSFAIAYLAVPLAFYAARSLLFLANLESGRAFIISVTAVPLLAASAAFLGLCALSGRLRVNSPAGAAAGAVLGVLHWFPLYLLFGSHFLWEPVSASSIEGSVGLYLFNLLLPVVALSGATYDGSLLAVLISIVLFPLLGFLWWRKSRRGVAA